MTDDIRATTLRVRFDADQVSDELQWQLCDPGQPCDATSADGFYSGALRFYPGESLALEVVGGAVADSGFTAFQIVDCCFITRPQVVYRSPSRQTRYAAPSPFLQALGGSYPLARDFAAALDGGSPAYRQITQRWKHTLDIGYASGRWELSFTLTVRIQRGPDEGPNVRVFQFDPESEVGTGSRPQQREPLFDISPQS